MVKQVKGTHQTAVPADPDQWSEQSKQSVAFYFKREYVHEPYDCRRCGLACVFTAQDQKYTFEVKKASIDQGRKFCAACWSESHQLRAAMAECEARWAADSRALQSDPEFLAGWLGLLTRWKDFAPRKQDVAKLSMLRRLLGPE